DASDLRKRMVVQEVQIGMVQPLEDHIRNNTGRVVPYASDIKDPMYISSVEKYNNLVLERDRQLLTTKPENPLVENLNSQIEILQKDLLTSLENVKLSMLIAQNELGKLNNQVVGDIQSTPSKERAMLDISRQQDVKQQLYLYLLQKREQTAIAKSGTLANSILIEPAQGDLQPIKPKAQLVYWAALIVGLLIPGAILFFVTLFDNKVREKKDITNATQATILGEIGHKKNHDFLVARQNSKTVLSEQFRTIRTNLGFTLNNKHDKVIMVTSGMNEEGKTFCSVNLATSLATSNKKVVLMDLDLRKPGVARALGIRTNKGFTAYMACKIDKEHVAESTDIHPKLFWIGSGQISYNPDELLLQERLAELFDYLKAEFDYIIVDTPPIGLVSDAVLIGKYADATIYILRQNFSLIRQLDIINDLLINTKVPGLCILVNDIKAGRGFSYGYGYVYNSNGYTMNEAAKKTHFWKKSNA
ncbi:MAG TPA: polysaccharide biosynthesis tyrosine autokinase, partial [Flavisolibacter sp.]|nr:polysaccharide biosynthesis tyrosine autokinase [Flavisolibacter sp.]